MPTWHVLRSDSVEQLLLVAVVANGMLRLIVGLEAEGLVQLQGLDVEARTGNNEIRLGQQL